MPRGRDAADSGLEAGWTERSRTGCRGFGLLPLHSEEAEALGYPLPALENMFMDLALTT